MPVVPFITSYSIIILVINRVHDLHSRDDHHDLPRDHHSDNRDDRDNHGAHDSVRGDVYDNNQCPDHTNIQIVISRKSLVELADAQSCNPLHFAIDPDYDTYHKITRKTIQKPTHLKKMTDSVVDTWFRRLWFVDTENAD